MQIHQKTQSELFTSIIKPEGVNVDLFVKACEDLEVQQVVQFILYLQKVLKLYDKPGRPNPFTTLPPQTLSTLLSKLKILQQSLKFTIYELTLAQILHCLHSLQPQSLPQSPPTHQQQFKKVMGLVSVEELLANPEVLNGKFSHPRFLYQGVINDVLVQVGRFILSINQHQRRYQAVLKGLNLCSYLIRPTEIQIQISKNTLLQARIFKMKYEYAFQVTQTQFLKKAANIINEAILCPSDARIQSQLLKLLKRMYRLWGQLIHEPLYLNLRNISLFFTEDATTGKMIKQAAIFCYSVINSKTDIKFADMLASSEDLGDIKRNQFYSSKGLALPFQLGVPYDTINLELPIWKYRLHLDKRQTYVYPIIIQKSNTLLYWKFQLQNYDIGFSVYKVSQLHKYQQEQYQKNPECKPIIKPTKYGSTSHKMPIKGQIFLKTGLYHLIFDNSYSMVRGKEILVEMCQLEAVL